MDVLFIHQNFPGHFRHIAGHLAGLPDFSVWAVGQAHAPGLNGVQLHKYRPHRKASSKTHPYAQTFEEAVLNGQQVLRLLLKLQQDTDVDFDPEFPATIDDCARISSRNALHLHNLENCDAAITLTHWQHALHPVAYQDKIKVIHEDIDATRLRPDSKAALQISAVHIYLTYPFVLSWSLLEPLASSCLVIASDTAPVREVIRHGDNGWLVNFFDNRALIERIMQTLSTPDQSVELRKKSQVSVRNYSIRKVVERYIKEMKEVRLFVLQCYIGKTISNKT